MVFKISHNLLGITAGAGGEKNNMLFVISQTVCFFNAANIGDYSGSSEGKSKFSIRSFLAPATTLLPFRKEFLKIILKL
jgi:hypothetical protein